MRHVAVFIGTRPEAIKMAPVVRRLEASQTLSPLVIATGQHREMLDQALDLFAITPNVRLDVMRDNQTLDGLTARLTEAIGTVLDNERPDMALVQGDTTTTFVAALAAFYRKIPTAHVEAGLRTGDIYAPFPEEMNRRLTSRLCALHFPPTSLGRQNLIDEGVDERCITVTGNTVIDALQMEVQRQRDSGDGDRLDRTLQELVGDGWGERPYVLITGHRRENFGGGFEQICDAIARLARAFSDHLFIYPVHLNPNVQRPVNERLGDLENVRLIRPLDYSTFVLLMSRCELALTDSGGVQEEAPAFGKPVLVMREVTERPEGVDAGVARLVGARAESIVASVTQLLEDESAYSAMAHAVNPYGDGTAAHQIVERIESHFMAHCAA